MNLLLITSSPRKQLLFAKPRGKKIPFENAAGAARCLELPRGLLLDVALRAAALLRQAVASRFVRWLLGHQLVRK